MIKFLKNFRKDEDGAVTVDWVVLTAAIVGLGIAVFTVIQGQTEDLAERVAGEIQNEIADVPPATLSANTGG